MRHPVFLEITCNFLKARGESRVQGGIGFGFSRHWLNNWCELFKPNTKSSQVSYDHRSYERNLSNCV